VYRVFDDGLRTLGSDFLAEVALRSSRYAPLPMVDGDFFAHVSAIVEDGASIGSGTKVWHHGHVRSGSRLGADCVLGKNVFIDDGAVVGDRCKIQNNVSVYNGVTIGDDVFVGPAATFTNDLVPRAFNTEWHITKTFVNTGASVGANATIICGTTLGEYSMVAAGATVTRSVAPHQLVAGTPARHLGWVCRCGVVVSRSADAPEDFTCEACEPEKAP
jgi:UDP-2-acetamido-3-amino-2,3-dideoxy-glucuronate N-acetyltransferase